jgi:hypothetical protein
MQTQNTDGKKMIWLSVKMIETQILTTKKLNLLGSAFKIHE